MALLALDIQLSHKNKNGIVRLSYSTMYLRKYKDFAVSKIYIPKDAEPMFATVTGRGDGFHALIEWPYGIVRLNPKFYPYFVNIGLDIGFYTGFDFFA